MTKLAEIFVFFSGIRVLPIGDDAHERPVLPGQLNQARCRQKVAESLA
jgi:hypothetical protein